MGAARIVRLPSLHPRMEPAILLQWLKDEGDPVGRGEALYVVETRKAVFELPSEFEGTVERLLVAAGTPVTAGQEIARIRTHPPGGRR